MIYYLDVLNELGALTGHYSANGIASPGYPVFDVFDIDGNSVGEGGNLSCWIDRREIGLKTNTDYYLQVCTVKGGIEPYKNVERPRELSGWDIADAFGEDNTKARVDADLDAGKKLLVKGFATVVRFPSEDEAA